MNATAWSAHARFRDRLAVLADAEEPLRAVAEAGERRGWWTPGVGWERSFGRFEPSDQPYATLVFEATGDRQHICRVEVFASRPAEDVGVQSLSPSQTLGWLRVNRFPFDPGLPTLARVVAAAPTTVVRYRPSRRCTMRVGTGADTRFVKVFGDGRGARIHAEGLRLWAAAQNGKLGFSVAPPDRFDRSTRSVWQSAVDGLPVAPRVFGLEGPALARRLGAAAASVPSSGLRPVQILGPSEQLRRSLRVGEEITRRMPHVAGEVRSLLERLRRVHARTEGRRLSPIHGAPHVHQWLEGKDGLGLVDFDRFALGEPELDVATFLAEMDFERGTAVGAVKTAFLGGYEEVAGPLDGDVLRAYRSHKRLAKALRSARALRADGDVRAERHLMLAVDCLEGERR